MDLQVDTAHNIRIYFDERSRSGMEYLRDDLSSDEAKVFFDQARQKSNGIKMEDDHNANYKLKYNGDNSYTIARL